MKPTFIKITALSKKVCFYCVSAEGLVSPKDFPALLLVVLVNIP